MCQFAWKPPPYEYEAEKMPIDCITGGDAVRAAIDSDRATPDALTTLADAHPASHPARVIHPHPTISEAVMEAQ